MSVSTIARSTKPAVTPGDAAHLLAPDRPAQSARSRRAWILVLGGPLAVFALLQWLTWWGLAAPQIDTLFYLRAGRSLLAGDGYVRYGVVELHFPPGASVGLALLDRLLGSPMMTVRLWGIGWNLAVAVLAIKLTHQFWGDRRRTILAAWIAAVAPMMVLMSGSGGGSEAPAAAGLLAAVSLVFPLLAGRAPSLWWLRLAVAGSACAFAMLCRPETLLASGLIGLALVLATRRQPGWSSWSWVQRLRSAVRVGAPFALALVVVCLPYLSFVHSHTGSWSPGAKAQDASIESWYAIADGRRADRDHILLAIQPDGLTLGGPTYPLTTLARENPDTFEKILRLNAKKTFTILAVPGIDGWVVLPLPLLLGGAVLVTAERRRPGRLLLGAIAATPLISSMMFFAQPRYFYLTGAVGIVCAAGAIGWVADRRGVSTGKALSVAAVLVCALVSKDLILQAPPWEATEQVADSVVAWTDTNLPPEARVMTRSYRVQDGVERETVAIPAAPPAQALAYARRMGVSHVIVEDSVLRGYRPELITWLLDEKSESAGADNLRYGEGLTLLRHFSSETGDARIFALDPAPAPSSEAPRPLGHAGDPPVTEPVRFP